MRSDPERICMFLCSLRSWALLFAFLQLVYSTFRFGGWATVCWLNMNEGCKNLSILIRCLPYLLMLFLYLVFTLQIFKGIYKNVETKKYTSRLMLFAVLKGFEVCLAIINLMYGRREMRIPILVLSTFDLTAALVYGFLVFLHARRQPRHLLIPENNNNLEKEPLPEPVHV